MNAFDGLSEVLFNTVDGVMGYDATWIKADSSTVTGRMLYRENAGEVNMQGNKIPMDVWKVQYRIDDFPGLKDLVKQSKKEKINVIIRGSIIEYLAVEATPVEDGAEIELKLKLKGNI